MASPPAGLFPADEIQGINDVDPQIPVFQVFGFFHPFPPNSAGIPFGFWGVVAHPLYSGQRLARCISSYHFCRASFSSFFGLGGILMVLLLRVRRELLPGRFPGSACHTSLCLS